MLLLAKRMAYAIVIAGMLFILLPTELGFQWPLVTDTTHAGFELIHRLDRPYNLFPSLHIALSTVVLLLLLAHAAPWSRPIFLLWWVLLCLSVVLVHQHHLADIAGGLVLAWAMHALVSQPELSEDPPETVAIDD